MTKYFSFLFLLLSAFSLLANYNAPKGTLVQTYPSSGKEFVFTSEHFASIPTGSDCMVLDFQYTMKSTQNSDILKLYDTNNPEIVLNISQTQKTFTVSREFSSLLSGKLPYLLYDQMFDAGSPKTYNIIIFIGPHFLWFEVHSMDSTPAENYYSPVFWGVNSTYEGFMDFFLSKSSNFEAKLGSNLNPDGNIQNLKIYLTKTADVTADIQARYCNTIDGHIGSPIITTKANNAINLISANGTVNSSIEDEENINKKNMSDILLFPNPLRMDEQMFIGFTLQNPSNIKVEIVSLVGSVEKTFDLGHCSSGRVEGHIDLSGLITGNYLVRLVSSHEIAIREVVNKEETIVKKIVKE